MNTQHKCEQQCGATADCYAGGKGAGDWAGRYCYACQQALGFVIFDDYNNTKGNTMSNEPNLSHLPEGRGGSEVSTDETIPTLVESVTEGVQWVANMMNSGRVNPKDVYPKGRYAGD
jgi:hypothetical protein